MVLTRLNLGKKSFLSTLLINCERGLFHKTTEIRDRYFSYNGAGRDDLRPEAAYCRVS